MPLTRSLRKERARPGIRGFSDGEVKGRKGSACSWTASRGIKGEQEIFDYVLPAETTNTLGRYEVCSGRETLVEGITPGPTSPGPCAPPINGQSAGTGAELTLAVDSCMQTRDVAFRKMSGHDHCNNNCPE